MGRTKSATAETGGTAMDAAVSRGGASPRKVGGVGLFVHPPVTLVVGARPIRVTGDGSTSSRLKNRAGGSARQVRLIRKLRRGHRVVPSRRNPWNPELGISRSTEPSRNRGVPSGGKSAFPSFPTTAGGGRRNSVRIGSGAGRRDSPARRPESQLFKCPPFIQESAVRHGSSREHGDGSENVLGAEGLRPAKPRASSSRRIDTRIPSVGRNVPFHRTGLRAFRASKPK